MKKRDVANLIRCYVLGDDRSFREQANSIASDFIQEGSTDLGYYLLGILNEKNVVYPMGETSVSSPFLKQVPESSDSLFLPTEVVDDLKGIINAISQRAGVNKFLFTGKPGTGKTEAARHLARILKRSLYAVEFSSLIDSKLGQSQKNLESFFSYLNRMDRPELNIILFDEIDALALDRVDSRDLREMGRITTSVLSGLDGLDENLIVIATTNLKPQMDRALLRRFDKIVNFDCYSLDDLVSVAEAQLNSLLSRFTSFSSDIRLFRKIVTNMNPVLSPGELKNAIRSSLAFSDPGKPFEYLTRLYRDICPKGSLEPKTLLNEGFTVREAGILSGMSKSQAQRLSKI